MHQSTDRLRAFAYLDTEKTHVYRQIMQKFMRAKEAFGIHLRPSLQTPHTYLQALNLFLLRAKNFILLEQAVLSLFGPGFTCVIERKRDGLRLAILCLDPARVLAQIFRRISTAIFMSATLSPLEATLASAGEEEQARRGLLRQGAPAHRCRR